MPLEAVLYPLNNIAILLQSRMYDVQYKAIVQTAHSNDAIRYHKQLCLLELWLYNHCIWFGKSTTTNFRQRYVHGTVIARLEKFCAEKVRRHLQTMQRILCVP